MNHRRLSDAYRFKGFKPNEHIVGIFGEPGSRVVRLERTGEKLLVAPAEESARASMTGRPGASAICPAATLGSTSILNPGGSYVRHAGR